MGQLTGVAYLGSHSVSEI